MSAPAARRTRIGVGLEESKRKNRDRSGNSFCHVDRMRHIGQDSPAMTFGNQKCRGAAPSLVRRPRRRSHLERAGSIIGVAAQIPPSISVNAPRIWLRRYFVADSCSGEVLFWTISGTKDRRLSSMPAKTESQLVPERAIAVPVTIMVTNISEENFGKGIRLCWFGRGSSFWKALWRLGENRAPPGLG